MISLKALSPALTASVALHVFLGYAMSSSGGHLPVSQPEPIQVEYMAAPPAASAPATAAEAAIKKPAAAVRKKVKGIPVPRTQAAPKPETTDFQKIVDEKIRKQLLQLKHLDLPSADTRISSSMTSAELIADPVKGSIFVGYFGQVKRKIQETVFQKAGRTLYGRGSVCLGFVLDSQGRLQQVSVLPKGTDAAVPMRELAVQCIQDSAPFGPFPKGLGPGSIYFNITIFFDGT